MQGSPVSFVRFSVKIIRLQSEYDILQSTYGPSLIARLSSFLHPPSPGVHDDMDSCEDRSNNSI